MGLRGSKATWVLLFLSISGVSCGKRRRDNLSLRDLMAEGVAKTEERIRSRRSAPSSEDEDSEESKRRVRLVSALLESILDDYDMFIRPDFAGPPLQVESNMVLTSMGPFSDFEAEFTFQCFFRHFWRDKRLAFANHSLFREHGVSEEEVDELILNSIMLDKVWKPDTFFRGNGMNSHIHDITRPNQLFRLKSNGQITFSTRITISAKCPMDFSSYPMDSQECIVEYGSFGYSVSDVVYSWPTNPKETAVDKTGANPRLAQFTLVHCSNFTRLLQTNSSEGDYSMLVVRFVFMRNIGYFVMQTYMPCMMIVVLSWVAFWINREAAPARISLGITTVLTMTTFAISSRQQIPKVSYPSAMDWFVFACYLFVFLALVEYAAVNYFTKRGEAGKKPTKKAAEGPPSAKKSREAEEDEVDGGPPPPFKDMNALWVRLVVCVSGSISYRKYKIDNITTQYNSVSQIDVICRAGFPLAFVMFNAIYWSVYLGATGVAGDLEQME